MTDTPIGDAVQAELYPPAGTTMDEFLEAEDDGAEDTELAAEPAGHNDDAEDDLSDVPEGEDSDDDLDDAEGTEDADPAAPQGIE